MCSDAVSSNYLKTNTNPFAFSDFCIACYATILQNSIIAAWSLLGIINCTLPSITFVIHTSTHFVFLHIKKNVFTILLNYMFRLIYISVSNKFHLFFVRWQRHLPLLVSWILLAFCVLRFEQQISKTKHNIFYKISRPHIVLRSTSFVRARLFCVASIPLKRSSTNLLWRLTKTTTHTHTHRIRSRHPSVKRNVRPSPIMCAWIALAGFGFLSGRWWETLRYCRSIEANALTERQRIALILFVYIVFIGWCRVSWAAHTQNQL